MSVGEQLSCSFFLPGSAHITADGEVARMESTADGKHLYGIRFTVISPEQRGEVENFIAESLKNIH
jgi:hypothetical protein